MSQSRSSNITYILPSSSMFSEEYRNIRLARKVYPNESVSVHSLHITN